MARLEAELQNEIETLGARMDGAASVPLKILTVQKRHNLRRSERCNRLTEGCPLTCGQAVSTD